MNKYNNASCIVFCPPYPQYEKQPDDSSKCELSNCPLCKNKMWLSEKKKAILEIASQLKKSIFLGCYDCFEYFAKENKHLLIKSMLLNI